MDLLLIYDSVLPGMCYEKLHNQTATPLTLQVLDIILVIIYCKRNSQLRTCNSFRTLYVPILSKLLWVNTQWIRWKSFAEV